MNEFSFDWVLTAYYELNKTHMCDLDGATKNKISQLFREDPSNYKAFIDKLAILLNISESDKLIYLGKETKCIRCHLNYPIVRDPFTSIYENDTNVTDKLCAECANVRSCSICGSESHEPWERWYMHGMLFLCRKCVAK